MIAFAVSMLLLAAQATPAPAAPAPAAPVVTAPPAAAVPAKPGPPSARLEDILVAMKGKPKTAFTSKLGPPSSVRQAVDGEVLFWSVKLAGATVCGANAAGALVCGRQGDGECLVVVAFDKAGASGAWRASGMPVACDKAADLFEAPAVTLPKMQSKPGQ